MIPNFWKSLIAVVVGNLVYFFVMFPYLPPAARHAPNRLDFGLLVDFGVCVLVFAALEFGTRSFGTPRGPSHRA